MLLGRLKAVCKQEGISFAPLSQHTALLCRCDIGAVKAVLWNDCRMGKNNEMGALFKAQGTVNTER